MTPDERLHFETFGFLFYRQLFTSDETEKITEAAEEVWTEALGRPPAGDEKMNVWPFVERHETLLRIIDDDRIHGPLTDLLGEDMIWSLSEGNRGFDPERPAHHWHADRAGKQELNYTRIKIMLYLDPTTKDQGAMRVIPGSHRLPLHEALQPFQKSHVEDAPTFFGMDGADVPCHAVESQPGDVLIFDQTLFHGVYGKTGRRRYIALKYAARPKCKAHLASLKNWSEYTFHPHQALLDCDRPRVQEMVRGLSALGQEAGA